MTTGALLISFGGLPGVGKSTLARALAAELRATWLRIDAIEQALRESGGLAGEIQGEGYRIAAELAVCNLSLGAIVVVDCVNPLRLTREMFRSAARRAQAPILEAHIVCADAAEHRRRVETRQIDVEGLRAPTWEEAVDRAFDPWPDADITLDSATLTPPRATHTLCAAARSRLAEGRRGETGEPGCRT